MNLTPKVVIAKQNTKHIKTHKAKYKNLCRKYVIKMEVDKKREKKINKNFEKLDYNFNDPFIILNPFKRTPLSAIIKFKTKKLEKIEKILMGNDFKKNHEYIIKWLLPHRENKLIIEGLDKNNFKRSVSFNIKTSKSKTIYLLF